MRVDVWYDSDAGLVENELPVPAFPLNIGSYTAQWREAFSLLSSGIITRYGRDGRAV
jgi:hypothetical protein